MLKILIVLFIYSINCVQVRASAIELKAELKYRVIFELGEENEKNKKKQV